MHFCQLRLCCVDTCEHTGCTEISKYINAPSGSFGFLPPVPEELSNPPSPYQVHYPAIGDSIELFGMKFKRTK